MTAAIGSLSFTNCHFKAPTAIDRKFLGCADFHLRGGGGAIEPPGSPPRQKGSTYRTPHPFCPGDYRGYHGGGIYV